GPDDRDSSNAQQRHRPETGRSLKAVPIGRLGNDSAHRTCRAPRRERIPNAAAQTRIVSKARTRLDSRKSMRSFKEIICDDISEFESHMPSHAVSLRAIALGLERPAEDEISLRGMSSVLMPLGRASFWLKGSASPRVAKCTLIRRND